MDALEFVPNSPALANAGRKGGQLSACFVLPVGDSLDAIFESVKWAAMIQQTGGGTGFSFSRLRPAGDALSSTQGSSSGPVSFIEVFNSATDAIRQGGVRRGANMGVLRVDHPDILEFVTVKMDTGRLRNFNLSVAITDEFMAALEAETTYALKNPRTGQETRRLEAKRVWAAITRSAWQSGEPGVIFIDRVNEAQPTPLLGAIEATNPCGELPLLPYESCNLGSIDVGKLVAGNDFDWARLGEVIHIAVRFLDDVIDANHYPFAAIDGATKATRKVGLGVMGLADALIRLGVSYDSEEGIGAGEKLARFVVRESEKASRVLARERGPFPAYRGSRWDVAGAEPMRNATTTTIAPTGTISIIAGSSSGIEPLYALSYVRRVLDGARLTEVHPLFWARGKKEGWLSEALVHSLSERGSCRGLAAVPEEVQRLFPTAHDIAPEWHLRMQAAFQKYVHNAVSKTINFARESSPLDVEESYRAAFRLGCKGITVYRDSSRPEQVLSFGSELKSEAEHVCAECGSPTPAGHQGACTVCLSCGLSACL
jgi:ribonucleoside-diphosphate reductase alpha chain